MAIVSPDSTTAPKMAKFTADAVLFDMVRPMCLFSLSGRGRARVSGFPLGVKVTSTRKPDYTRRWQY